MSDEVTTLIGKRISKATSSLKNFSIHFEGEHGLQMDSLEGPRISAKVVPNTDLPVPTEAVCAVDWSWIYKSQLKSITVHGPVVKLELDGIGPLVVTAGSWQGSSFLGFQPYKPAARV
ncbi:MAG: hypothetical protein JST44_05930 [Cyanobacteria bacterium SZAS LIN-5]|nr:hypothetical protein [Cyanobacteria bacterium SZAS LIN-5]